MLSRTAFFPTSGGQPHDVGTLDAAQVIDVIEADGVILHVVTQRVSDLDLAAVQLLNGIRGGTGA